MIAHKINKGSNLHNVLKACTEILKRCNAIKFAKIRFIAESDTIYATNGYVLLWYKTETHLSDRNCTLTLAGDYVVCEEEEHELDARVRKPFEDVKVSQWEDINWRMAEAYSPFEILQIIAEHGVFVDYRMLKMFSFLRWRLTRAGFQSEPQNKPLLFEGDGLEILLMPRRRL